MSKIHNSWQFHDPVRLGKRGVEFYTKKVKSDLYVFFTETSGIKYDWITNFTFIRCPLFENDKKLQCHKGFLSLSYIAMNVLQDIVNASKIKITRFYIYGVSQGGAVAVLTSLLLQNTYTDCIFMLETYGSPACLNLKLKEHIENITNISIKRKYYSLDIIVNLIPYLLFGFFYAGTKVVLKQKWYKFFTPVNNHRKIVDLGYARHKIKE